MDEVFWNKRCNIEELKSEFKHMHWLEETDCIEVLQEGKGHVGQGHIICLFGPKD